MKPTSLFLILLMSQNTQGQDLFGTANDLKTGEFRYFERHAISRGEDNLTKMIRADYLNKDGQVFASMTSNFSEDSFLPEISFQDSRFSISETQSYNVKQKKLVLLKSEKNREPQKKELTVVDNMVSGQGFNNFLLANFDHFAKKAIHFNFVVLSKMDFYRFEVVHSQNANADERSFSLSPGNFLFRMFSHPIEVAYDLRSKRLLRYKGLSNILSDSGKSQEVLITYKEVGP
jgi:hypothetical protein